MHQLLAIDTCAPKAVVGLMTDGELVSRVSSGPRQAAQQVLPMIADLLVATHTSLAQLDAIAVKAGPGSFTGLRIGIGVTQGLSLANSLPAIALSSLAVMAMAAMREAGVERVLVSQIARRDEVYFGAYRRCDQAGVRLVGREQVAAPGQLELKGLQKRSDWHAVGDGWACLEQIQAIAACTICAPVLRAEARIQDLCDLALLRIARGEAVTAEQLRPNYIKEQLDYSPSAC